jgi:hypothetical protein
MPDEKVVPIKKAAKEEPKKRAVRKTKKSTDEVKGPEILPEHEVSAETEGSQAEKQDSPFLEDTPPVSPLPEVLPPPEPLTGKILIDQAVEFINETANKSVYLGYLAIGAYVLKHFYGGDIALATSRNPKKPVSYTALCKREDLVVKPESLSVMLRVAAQEKFFAESEVDTTTLTYSHKAELVKLPNNKSKIDLVKKAISELLSVRDLSELVDKARKKPLPEQRLLAGDLDRLMFSPDKLFDDPSRTDLLHDDQMRKEQLRNLKGKTRRKLLEKVSQAVEKAEEWIDLYEDLKRDLEELESEKTPRPPDE